MPPLTDCGYLLSQPNHPVSITGQFPDRQHQPRLEPELNESKTTLDDRENGLQPELIEFFSVAPPDREVL